MLLGPGIKSFRYFIGHVIPPVADLALAYELRLLLRNQLLHVDSPIALHAIKLQMLADAFHVLFIEQLRNIEELSTSFYHGWQITHHILVLDKQDVFIEATLPERQHMLPIRAHGRVAAQK